MPTKRTRVTRTTATERITPKAIVAWQAGDYWALWHALGLKLWQMPDWNCNPPNEREPQPLPGYRQPDTAALRKQLIEVAGPPPRRWFYKRED